MAMKIEGMQEGEGLDDLFAEACVTAVQPSDALMARVLADALDAQPRAMAPASAARVVPAAGLWMRLVGLFGGAGALAGMGTAAVAGLLIGFAQPGGLAALGDAMLGPPLETVELFASVDALLVGN
jgi:hypothetical protein